MPLGGAVAFRFNAVAVLMPRQAIVRWSGAEAVTSLRFRYDG
jgi:hypothetical protein